MADRQPSTAAWMAAYTLAERELVRFLRQRNRVFGALVQPLIFWAIFGFGLNSSFRPATGTTTVSYSAYFFPGTVVLILLFTAIFATISIIEDRNEGFLQSVLAAPVPRWSIVLGKVAGTTVLAVGQALAIFVLAPLAGIHLDILSLCLSVPLLIAVGFGLAALGFVIAWRTDSTQGFPAIMTALLMPMWLLSGAFFPPTGLPTWLAAIVAINPLTYGVVALRRLLYASDPTVVAHLPSMPLSLTVIVVFALLMMIVAVRIAGRQNEA